ncbi:MAG: AsmA family protein [Bdellovibrionota bacterium]
MKKQVMALYGLIILTLIVIGLTIWGPLTKNWVKRTVAQQLTKYLEAPIDFTDIRFGFFPPSVEFQNIQMSKDNSPLQFVSAGKIRVSMALSPSISGRIRIKNVEIEQPTLKFNFADFKFDRGKEEKEEKKKFRLPTLRDLLKVQIDQIEISKTALSFEFPGKYFFEMDSDTASYRRDKGTEYWSWNGQATARKGKGVQTLDNVVIMAKRKGQKIELEKLEIEGIQNHVLLTGQAYPDANMDLQVSGETDDLMRMLRDMELLKGEVNLNGNYKISSKLRGPWEDLNQDGKVIFEQIDLGGRKFDQLLADFQVRKNQIKTIRGHLNVNDTSLQFNVNNILQNKKAQFTVRGENVNYGDVQRSIDPTVEPILRSLLDVDVQGEITIQPFTMKGNYKVRGQQMVFDFPPMLTPYIPLELKNIEADGTVDWDMDKGCLLEGPIKTAGMVGSYKFKFPEPAVVDGTWDFGVNRFGDLFTKDYPVSGKGKITGGLQANDGKLRANFLMDIKDLQYAKYEKSTLTGDLIFTDEGTHVSKVVIATNNKRGIAEFDGAFGHGDQGQTSMEGTVKNFNLAWVSDLVARRFPFVEGIQGRGSATVSLHGPNEAVEGKILFDSENMDWKNEHLDQVSARLRVTQAGLDLQDVRFSAEQFRVSGQGSIANDRYEGLSVKMTRVPVALLGMPEWLRLYVTSVDGDLYLNGPLENPDINLVGKCISPTWNPPRSPMPEISRLAEKLPI